eukprot:1186957-Prorocentrum_minimum.AAC.3
MIDPPFGPPLDPLWTPFGPPQRPELEAESERLSKMEYSCAVIAYNWCVEGKLAGLLQHNVFLGSDYV